MLIKDILHTLKEDVGRLRRYNNFRPGAGGKVDYNTYWDEVRGDLSKTTLSHYQRQRAELSLPFIADGDRVVDVGCAEGSLLQYIRSKRNIRATGVEVSEDALRELSRREIPALKIDLADIAALSAVPECDVLMGFEILEHLPNPEEVIGALAPRVRKHMLFSFPNTGYWTHRARLLLGRFPLQWDAHPGEHLRFWTLTDLTWWAATLGYHISVHPYEGPPGLKKIWPKLFAKGIFIVIDPRSVR